MNLLFKLGIFLAIMLCSLFGKAQSQSDKIFDMFSGKDGVTSFSVSKSAIKPFEVFIDDETKKVIYNMKKIRFLHYNENKGQLSALNVYTRVKSELNGSDYFEIDLSEMNTDHSDFDEYDNITLFGRGNRYNMDEFHMVIFDNETSLLLSFYGDITIDDLKQLGKFSKSTQNFITL